MNTQKVIVLGGQRPGRASLIQATRDQSTFDQLPPRSQQFLRDLGETPESHRYNQERERAAQRKRERRIVRNLRNEAHQGNEPEGLELRGKKWFAVCRSCQCDYEIYCMPQEFEPDMSYCGGSEWCCP